ncbi:HPr family phosphocarrier protein [Agitococcus lubricus]|uniref:Phosphocarrier protein NPr/phosphocarrier protein n=1 Tax=Agitococcus lubricus TaxID=1077255 RepID=A0A2T5IZK3_9GAMM|nr:HPr family phosphocarrier protein [Agitococcus lubricus]PTQ89432.1 phosphocarrier protein NPr/phosphocarrier protein [Agitococcus lubricus]
MITTDICIINKLGLHARATAKLVALASGFRSSIKLTKGSKTVDAKNMMGVLMLGAGKGTTLGLMIDGDDAEQAHQAIVDLFNRRFDEGE